MSKVVTSPVKRWPGTVTLAEPLSFPQFAAWNEAAIAAQAVIERKGYQHEFDAAMLPAIRACVEAWDLTGPGAPTRDFYPATPRRASEALTAWLIGEISRIATEADEVPNA